VAPDDSERSSSTFSTHDLLGSWRDLFPLSRPLFVTAFVSIAITRADILLLTMFVDWRSVGIYALAVKLINLTSFPLGAMINIFSPKFAEAHQLGSAERLANNAKIAVAASAATSIPILLVLVAFPDAVLGVFGPEFVEAKSVIYVLAVSQLVNVSVGPIGQLMWTTTGARALQFIMLVTLAVSVSLNLILVPRLGILGAAAAGFSAVTVKNVSCWVYVWRVNGINMSIFFPGSTRSAETA
jgi:O-antigen/teichoic acid export membrane protein